MKLHRYVDHQRLHIVTKDVISLSISVLLLFRHYISHKITFGAPSSGGVLCSACGAFISSPEPKAHGGANSIPVTPASVRRPSSVRPSVRPQFQTSSPLKPLGQLNSNYIWRLLRTRERKFVQMVLVTWPRWPPRPYMVKTL